MVSFEDFSKLELKIGTIIEAEAVEASENLIRLKVDLGEEAPRQILARIRKWFAPADLVGEQVVVAANLEPKMMMGLESQGMLLAAGDEPVLLTVSKEVPPGTKVR